VVRFPGERECASGPPLVATVQYVSWNHIWTAEEHCLNDGVRAIIGPSPPMNFDMKCLLTPVARVNIQLCVPEPEDDLPSGFPFGLTITLSKIIKRLEDLAYLKSLMQGRGNHVFYASIEYFSCSHYASVCKCPARLYLRRFGNGE
jgi:hypothetical protein